MGTRNSQLRITFYSDVPFVGGHERMSARLANEIAKGDIAAVSFVTCNDELIALLNSSIDIHRTSATTKLPAPFLHNLLPGHVNAVKAQFREIDSDVVIVCQGDVEFCCTGLLAAKGSKSLVVSYIPMAFTFGEMAAKLAPMRDRLAKKWYRFPDAFITINEYQGRLLRRFTNCPIWAVPNPMDESTTSEFALDGGADSAAGGKRRHISLGIIGRVAFRQKNHPAMIRVMKELRSIEPGAICHVIGDGPDLGRLRALVHAEELGAAFEFHGWVARDEVLRLLRDEVDMVAIPSRFEGVPLVLLEAIASKTPFLISPFPWLEDYKVPLAMQANWSDPRAVVKKIQALKASSTHKDLKGIYEKFTERHSPASFQIAVREVLNALMKMHEDRCAPERWTQR